ncbi:MAG: hypothetical protein WBN36_14495, partial [Gammaproteobacteria bacterium]
MRLSMNPTTLRPWPLSARKPLKKLGLCAVALAACSLSMAHADATLTYELSGADGGKTVKKFSISNFYNRIDDSIEKDRYLLYQAGRFHPVYSVNTAESSYMLLTPDVIPYMGPQSQKHHGAIRSTEQRESEQATANVKKPAPKFKPTKNLRKVAGIECRVVNELIDNKPIIEHCMANSARLGVTKREVITMARTFEIARNYDFGWLGASTIDEEFFSIYSRDLQNKRVMQLTAV